MAKLSQEARERLSSELVKLADLMETCDYGDANHREYNRDYRRISKALYPEMYPSKPRGFKRPSKALLRTLKPCDCGRDGWRYVRNEKGAQFSCKGCGRTSEMLHTNVEARDSWNNSFNNIK